MFAILEAVDVPPREAILCQRFTAHTSTVSSALVLEDAGKQEIHLIFTFFPSRPHSPPSRFTPTRTFTPSFYVSNSLSSFLFTHTDNTKKIITTGLDKTAALWTSTGDCEELCGQGYELSCRLALPGGPAFSLVHDDRQQDGLPNQIFLGLHSRTISTWVPPATSLDARVNFDNHTGWVRGLALAQNRWLFSAACNTIRQWDVARAVPSDVTKITLDKGDILCLEAGRGRLYAASADGTLFSWSIDRKTGDLVDPKIHPKAHSERITSIILGGNMLYSVGYDGAIKAWDAESLEYVMGVSGSHDGERVHCAALAGDGLLYTGGDDNLVRRWDARLLTAMGPLHCHNHSVRVMASGNKEVLLSGDKSGEIAVWKI